MPTFRRKPILAEAVQWKNDDQAWEAVRKLHADSELVALKNDDGTVSIETPEGRVWRSPATGSSRVPKATSLYRPDAFVANYERA